jgi:hypothetical protein
VAAVGLAGQDGRQDQDHQIDHGTSQCQLAEKAGTPQQVAADPQYHQRQSQDGQGPGAFPVIQLPQDTKQHGHGHRHAQHRQSGAAQGPDQQSGQGQKHTGGENRPAQTGLFRLFPGGQGQDQTRGQHHNARDQHIQQGGIAGQQLIDGSGDIKAANHQQIQFRNAARQKQLHSAVHGFVALDRLGIAVGIF